MTTEKRLELAARIAALVREQIERSGGTYDGRMIPTLQSIIDIATVDESYLAGVEESLSALKRQYGIR